MNHRRHLELALDSLNQALLILDQRRNITYTSPAAAAIIAMQDGLSVAEAGLRINSAAAEQALQRTLGRLPDGGAQTLTVEVERPSGRTPYTLRIRPLQADDADPACSGALIIIQDAHANHAAWCERLMARYGLTPRECECAILLAEGHTMAEAAERLAISTQTLRQHLKRAFSKTGTHKQHELVSLLLPLLRKR